MCDVKRCRQLDVDFIYDVPECHGKPREVCRRCSLRHGGTKTSMLAALGLVYATAALTTEGGDDATTRPAVDADRD